ADRRSLTIVFLDGGIEAPQAGRACPPGHGGHGFGLAATTRVGGSGPSGHGLPLELRSATGSTLRSTAIQSARRSLQVPCLGGSNAGAAVVLSGRRRGGRCGGRRRRRGRRGGCGRRRGGAGARAASGRRGGGLGRRLRRGGG